MISIRNITRRYFYYLVSFFLLIKYMYFELVTIRFTFLKEKNINYLLTFFSMGFTVFRTHKNLIGDKNFLYNLNLLCWCQRNATSRKDTFICESLINGKFVQSAIQILVTPTFFWRQLPKGWQLSWQLTKWFWNNCSFSLTV